MQQEHDEKTPGLYLRGERYWIKFKIDGQEFRESLRTDDMVEAQYRAGLLTRRHQRRHFGSINPTTIERVYFIHDLGSGMIKVGISRDPGTRLRALKVNNPNEIELLGSIRGSIQLEAVLHQFLGPFHHRREWFRSSPAVLQFIVGLVAMDDELMRRSR